MKIIDHRRLAPTLLRYLGISISVTTLLATTAAASDNWPSFRGIGAQGQSQSSPPIEWNGEDNTNILWKTEIPGLGHSSPVTWDDRVFVTSAVRKGGGDQSLKVGLYGNIAPVEDDSEYEFTVSALSLDDGKVLWTRTAYSGVPKIKRHTKATHANSTPATDGQHVVVMFGSEGLYCYTVDGELLWKKDLGVLDSGFFRVPSAQWGFASSPIIHKGRVILQADVQKGSFLAAFDIETGEEIWRTEREEVPTWSTPAIAPRPRASGGSDEQIVVNGWKHIGGYDFDTGEELWRLTGGGDIPVPTPIVADDVVLITNAHGNMAPVYAVRTTATGDISSDDPRKVEGEHMKWMHDRGGNYMQTPLVIGDLVYLCSDRGVMTVLELETGERVYQQRLGTGSSGFSGSPVYADGRIYYTSEDGDTHVVKTGREFELLANNELGETFMSSPAIVGDRLLMRARTHLFAIGTSN